MADERLREYERDWAAGGDPDAAARYDREHIRMGEPGLSPPRSEAIADLLGLVRRRAHSRVLLFPNRLMVLMEGYRISFIEAYETSLRWEYEYAEHGAAPPHVKRDVLRMLRMWREQAERDQRNRDNTFIATTHTLRSRSTDRSHPGDQRTPSTLTHLVRMYL